MSSPSAPRFSGQRRKQATMAFLFGLFLVLGTLLNVVPDLAVTTLPRWTTAITADESQVHLVGMVLPTAGARGEFFSTHSTHAVKWSEPVTRTGLLWSAAAADGWLYCVVTSDVSAGPPVINAYRQDQWKVLPTSFDWRVQAVGTVGDTVWCFGLKPPDSPRPSSTETVTDSGHGVVYSARFEDDRWAPGPSLKVSEDTPTNMQLVSQADGEWLYWQTYLAREDSWLYRLFPGIADWTPPQRLFRCTFDGETFGPVESFDLGQPCRFVVVGEPDRALLLSQTISVSWFSVRMLPTIHRAVIKDGALTVEEDLDLESFKASSLVPDDFTAARFRDQTLLCVSGLRYGKYLTGMRCFQLTDSGTVEGPWILRPTADQVQAMILWTVVSVFGVCWVSAGVLGLGRALIMPDRSPIGLSPFASIVERATAAGIDLVLVGFLPWVLLGHLLNLPLEALLVSLAAVLVYGTVMEAGSGQTLGKRMTGLRVTNLSGEPPTLWAAFVRNLFKPVEILTVGALFMLATRRFRRLGDLLAGTVVMGRPTWTGSETSNHSRPDRLSGDES